MPFIYYGGKKALARYYPAPACPTIIEPFAGSAGYALHWATAATRVILIERDPAIVALWRQLQSPTAARDLATIRCPPVGELTDDPWLLLLQAGVGGIAKVCAGRAFTVTTRMTRNWPQCQRTLIAALERVRGWEIIEGDFTAAPDLRATWFVDPPYWVPDDARGSRGDGYRFGADQLDFPWLGDWCRARRGQVIVCEQEGATWLPFRPLRRMTTATGDGGQRVEVVWSRTPGKVRSTPKSRQLADEAARRRADRIAR